MTSSTTTKLVGIGASAGGLEALQELLEYLPANLDISYIIVQHLSTDFKSTRGELLAKHTSMQIKEACEAEEIRPRTIYLIPVGKLLRVTEGKIYLSDFPPNIKVNLPINELFRSMSEERDSSSIGIVLSGTGSDGSRGVQFLKQSDALVIVQNPEEAKFDGMPKSAIDTGAFDHILNIKDIPAQIESFFSQPKAEIEDKRFREHLSKNGKVVDDILDLIYKHTDLNFRAYKESTVSRRIEHRMSINRKSDLLEYWQYINDNKKEIILLKQDLLIGVTQFFRDCTVWDIIYTDIAQTLLKQTGKNKTLRIWCPGCSTGEEAYSYAILFTKVAEELDIDKNITVFATDIDEAAINYAAAGTYPSNISDEVPQDYLTRYFTELDDGSYRVNKEIRNNVVFAVHNLIQDPPFSNMNLVSCRNTLIYMQNSAQQKVMTYFHFSLQLNGVLVLGSAESLGPFSIYFDSLDQKNRLYQKNKDMKVPSPIRNSALFTKMNSKTPPSLRRFTPSTRRYEKTKQKSMTIGQKTITEEYLPPTLITNNKLTVLYSYGDTSAFTRKLEAGQASFDLAKLLDRDISGQAISAANESLRKKKAVLMRNIYSEKGTSWDLRCISFKEDSEENYVAVSFIPSHDPKTSEDEIVYEKDAHAQKRIEELEKSLIESQQLHRQALEDLDTTSEELQSSNEELISANEKLQSINEELQSVNEELYTVNSEYQQKITELTDINSDLENLMLATHLAVLFLTSDLKIRRFTGPMRQYLNIIDFDINRDFRDLSFNSPLEKLPDLVLDVKNSEKTTRQETFGSDDNKLEVTVSQYTSKEKISGFIISIVECP
ncbi:chemotaxis protein CheR [Salinimonas iocasae]|uniref:protein-glutamate O-methyltransferase n=1 Tax=Salinimonas iocasae TaxID=2572577 RepID=A0A5B7YIF4_9ALTE|nr:chemotaxis protein CheR [Salinimonas iocasae]